MRALLKRITPKRKTKKAAVHPSQNYEVVNPSGSVDLPPAPEDAWAPEGAKYRCEYIGYRGYHRDRAPLFYENVPIEGSDKWPDENWIVQMALQILFGGVEEEQMREINEINNSKNK